MMMLFGFGSFRAAHVIHVEVTMVAFLPLMVAAFVHFLDRPTRGRATIFGLMMALASIEYSYVAVPLWLVFPIVIAYGARRRGISWTIAVLPFLIAASVCAICLAPIAVHYFTFFKELGVSRTIDEVHFLSADWRIWLTGPTGQFLPPFGYPTKTNPDSRLFPGFITLALAMLGFSRLRRRSPEVVLVGILGLLLSFGSMRFLFWRLGLPFFPFPTPYEILFDFLFPLRAIRAAARMGILAHLVIGCAGAMAVTHLATRDGNRLWKGRVLAGVLVLMAFLESRAGMNAITILPDRFQDESYAWVARQEGDFAVIDLPMGSMIDPRRDLLEIASLYPALTHGRRTPNGTMATPMYWHQSIAAHVAHPWSRSTPVILRALGIGYAVARDDTAAGDCRAAGLKEVFASRGGYRVFAVDSAMTVPRHPAELQERLFEENHPHLSASTETLSISIDRIETIKARAGAEYEFYIVVTNTGTETWCARGAAFGMGPTGDPVIAIRTWMEHPAPDTPLNLIGRTLSAGGMLTRDLTPGESTSVLIHGLAPLVPGHYRASLDLYLQKMRWNSPLTSPPGVLDLEVLPWWTKEKVSERYD